MPLYELFCLARPTLTEPVLKDIVKKAAVLILDKGGVLCDIKSYGVQELGYPIRKPNDEAYKQAAMWGMNFMAGPSVLPEVEHDLRVEEGVLRWAILKQKAYPNLPKPTQLFYIPELDNPNRKRRSPLYPPPSMMERE
ncbi:hypothetical protein BSKO_09834 [Bryopsis sp. KO-2023]|nr:hypothetical protein BSKO_09834 [Bryopsis sp. KO-2023]